MAVPFARGSGAGVEPGEVARVGHHGDVDGRPTRRSRARRCTATKLPALEVAGDRDALVVGQVDEPRAGILDGVKLAATSSAVSPEQRGHRVVGVGGVVDQGGDERARARLGRTRPRRRARRPARRGCWRPATIGLYVAVGRGVAAGRRCTRSGRERRSGGRPPGVPWCVGGACEPYPFASSRPASRSPDAVCVVSLAPAGAGSRGGPRVAPTTSTADSVKPSCAL